MKKSENYFNTTNQDQDFVKQKKTKNKNQEQKVYKIFQGGGKYTASEIYNLWSVNYAKNIPLTSIRRAMSNLQHDRQIIKTNETKIGIYGAPEHYYTLYRPIFANSTLYV
tara:strand:+ start:11487 stop:11816 length:330 start_codon:yes stop_codon:yes gene_type:complete